MFFSSYRCIHSDTIEFESALLLRWASYGTAFTWDSKLKPCSKHQKSKWNDLFYVPYAWIWITLILVGISWTEWKKRPKDWITISWMKCRRNQSINSSNSNCSAYNDDRMERKREKEFDREWKKIWKWKLTREKKRRVKNSMKHFDGKINFC